MVELTFRGKNNVKLHESAYTIGEFTIDKAKYPICTRHKIEYYNIPCAFDIETTNMRANELKESYGYMYHWQFCLDDIVIFGRTWQEFLEWIERLRVSLELNSAKYIVIYCHNLGMEWQYARMFMHQIDDDISEFYTDKNTPLVVRCKTLGIEFRCSWKLSNKSLKKFVEECGSLYIKQVDVEYDYNKIRTPETQMTAAELAYCYCDVRGLADAIRYAISDGSHNIANLPLTSTGYVRRDTLAAHQQYDNYVNGYYAVNKWVNVFKKLTEYNPYYLKAGKHHTFRELIKSTQITPDVYAVLLDAGRGGITQANAQYSGMIIDNVISHDRKSSYPAVLMTYKYPVGKWVRYNPKNIDILEEYLLNMDMATIGYLYLSDVEIKPDAMPYISVSKCKNAVNCLDDNGKVFKAKKLKVAVTEIDYVIIKASYTFVIEGYGDIYRCDKDYLPLPLRAVNLYYFTQKCEITDPYEYAKFKNRFNAIFGMTYTRPTHDTYQYDYDTLDWTCDTADPESALIKYYNNKGTCLRYDWGVYTTAYARYELHLAVVGISVKNFLYSDTDSAKWFYRNQREKERILSWFAKRNEELKAKAIEMAAYYGTQYLGVWEYEGEYKRFVTYGAKKYAYGDKDGKLHVTVAGLSKQGGEDYYKSIDNFVPDTTVPAGISGRMTAVIRDEPIHTINVEGVEIETASSLSLYETTYTLSPSNDWEWLLKNGYIRN